MNEFNELAIIIPIAPGDQTWQTLLQDLLAHVSNTEIILVGTLDRPTESLKDLVVSKSSNTIAWLQTSLGRAKQLNHGARSTERKFIWFLHADSRMEQNAVFALRRSLRSHPNALLYFNLKFLADGPKLTAINTLGVWVRSHFMHLPFGDQGFCISRKLFLELGGFSEKAEYGEDHLFVWAARNRGISLRCTGAAIATSARKYQKLGWGKTTLLHSLLTARQALPEGAGLVMKKIREKMPW